MVLLVPDGSGWADLDDVRRHEAEQKQAAEAVAQLDYASMSEHVLMQMEWSGRSAGYYLRDLRSASTPVPVALTSKEERRVAIGRAADAELTRRGIEERYC